MISYNASPLLFNKCCAFVNRTTKMVSCPWFWTVSFIVPLLSACGGVDNMVITQPDNIHIFKEVKLMEPEVSSEKQDVDTLALNEELKKIAYEELHSLLTRKNIVLSNDRKTSVKCHIEVDYGNRALRYIVGFGAGAGHIRIMIEMKDDGGVTRYATSSEAYLAMGALGGNMLGIAREAIRKSVYVFGSRL